MRTVATTSLVLGYDRSVESRHALTAAAELASRLQAHLHIVHVVDLADYPIDPDSGTWEDDGDTALGAESAQVHVDLAGWRGEWTYHLQHGDPVHALLAAAEAHDSLMIVVVGTRAGGFGTALQRLLAGTPSVSHGLLGHHRPVLLVPMP